MAHLSAPIPPFHRHRSCDFGLPAAANRWRVSCFARLDGELSFRRRSIFNHPEQFYQRIQPDLLENKSNKTPIIC